MLTKLEAPCTEKVNPMQVKEPYDVLDMITCRFSSHNFGVYKITSQPIMSERARGSI